MPPALSVVVVCHDMARELPRTLRTLQAGYQRGIDANDYEVVVVDNGSAEPLVHPITEGLVGRARIHRIHPAPPSPAHAANVGLREARGEIVGLIVDGARMASPGLLAAALVASELHDRAVVGSLGWHLGPARHMDASAIGYDQTAEDALLQTVDWVEDGYELFTISTLAASSSRGWFGSLGESSALFMRRSLWAELGGLDEAFGLAGGGLVNHDLYRRAADAPDARLVTILGEGTFHQFHGGAATSNRLTWDEMHADYVRLRGRAYEPPDRAPLLVGHVPAQAMAHLDASLRLAAEREERRDQRRGDDSAPP